MNEKEILAKAESIVEALTSLSLGKEPSLLSGATFKKLATHLNFIAIRDAYIAYLQAFDGKIETAEEIKRIFEFRMEVTILFEQ